MPRVHILPLMPEGEDKGDGGIRQVIRGQHAHLPDLGWEVVRDPAEADVIHCHVTIPPTYLKLYGDKPILVSNHGAYWHGLNDLYEWEKWSYEVNVRVLETLRTADLTTAVSQWTANALRRASNRDVRVVYHGVNLEEWPEMEPSNGTPYVLWNKTRVDPICDPEPLLQLAQLMPEVQFVTTHPDNARGRNLTVTGTQPYREAQRLVQRAAVYLCTTRETFGIGTLEALASGVPVVGYAWGGQREIIEHGVDGWLVQPGDIEGLREGVRWALGNTEARQAARAKAERFPVQGSVAQYAALYDELLARFAERKAGPKVSVIVPAYNLEKYLPDTLRSVVEQDFEDWECIIVDDASTDGTGAIADAVAGDPRFRVIHHETNQYLAAARNTGIAAARGRYILPLDADDMITPLTLRVLSEELDKSREIDIAYGNVLFVDEDGTTPTVYKEGPSPGHSAWPVEFRLDWMFYQRGQPLPYASMFRREVWEQTGGYRTRARSSEDCDFWLRTSSYGFVPEMVTRADTLIYRNRPGSMSRDQGWQDEEHRRWYPWIADNELLPAAAYRGQAVGGEQIPFPALDPVISVVIPVGPGHGKWLHDAVDSVDSQTFRLWECIVVNDSGEELPPLPTWVRVVEPGWLPAGDLDTVWDERGTRKVFGGAAAARNAGIATARGALYLPLDADDYLQPKALELMLMAHMTAPSKPIVYSDFWDEFAPGESKVYQCPDYEPRTLISHGLGRAVTALTPIRYWRDVGGYDENVAWEDWAFAISCAAKGFCERRVAAPLFTYRKWTGLRREENIADFEASKASIMQKDFGVAPGGELMACQTCGGGRGSTMGFASAPQPGAMPPAGDTVMVEYLGGRMGGFGVNSIVPNWPKYRFSAENRQHLVRVEDAPYFEAHEDYRVIPTGELAGDPVVQASPVEPALVALGAPQRDPRLEFGGIPRLTGDNPNTGLPWYHEQVAPPQDAFSVSQRSDAVEIQPQQWIEQAAAGAAEAVATMERPAEPTGSFRDDPAPAHLESAIAANATAPTSPSASALIRNNTREQLEERAERLGIPNAASLGNMRQLANAIVAVEATRPDLGLEATE